MALQFRPKILGLNIEIVWTVFGQSGTEFRTVCTVFIVLLIKKMNNMLVV